MGVGRAARLGYLTGFAAILALGAWLRLRNLGGPALWLDEILTLRKSAAAAHQPWHAWLLGFSHDVENGPAFHALQLLAQRHDVTEVAVRVAPALCGLAGVAVLGVAGTWLAGRWCGLTVALLTAVAPLHVYYSREGRPYAMVLLAAALLIAAFVAPASRTRAALAWSGALLGAAAGVFSGPILATGAAAAAVPLFTARGRRGARRAAAMALLTPLVVGLTLLAVLYLHKPRYRSAVGHGTPAATTQPMTARALGRMGASLTVSGLEWGEPTARSGLVGALALAGLLATWRVDRRRALELGAFAVLPAALALAVLVYLAHWYSIRYTAAALPAVLLLAGSGAAAAGQLAGRLIGHGRSPEWSRWTAGAVGAALLAAIVPAYLSASLTEPGLKLDWRRPADLVSRYAVPGETIVASNFWTQTCLAHYLAPRRPDLRVVNARESIAEAERLAADEGAAWLASGGFHRDERIRAWMGGFRRIWSHPLEQFGLYYYPDHAALVAARRDPAAAAPFTADFAGRGRRLEADDDDALYFGGGWSQPETDPDGMTFRWATGDVAALALPGHGATLIRLRLLPFDYPGAPAQQVEVTLGEASLGMLVLEPGWATYDIAVPPDSWTGGVDRLELRFSRSAAPRDVLPDSADGRRLSAALDVLLALDGAAGSTRRPTAPAPPT